jgi:hypothetical protein
MRDVLADLKADRARDIAQKAVSFDEFKQITKFAEWAAIEEKFGK